MQQLKTLIRTVLPLVLVWVSYSNAHGQCDPDDTPPVMLCLSGKIVQQVANDWYAAGTNNVPLQLSNLPSGVYAIKLNTPSGAVTQRVVLTK